MQLLYLYIFDDRRNIKNCEFNFSPLYHFHYNIDSRTFNKEELNSVINDFWFGKNIQNITAIIGNNGAGKSNLLENIVNTLITQGRNSNNAT